MQNDPRYETLDSILGGRLTIIQPITGYRFAIDSILLGDFVHTNRNDRVLELGAGCGVIAAMIALVHRPREVRAIELQSKLASCAARNAILNRLADMQVCQADLRASVIPGLSPASFDWVVANPPYRAPGAGRESPDASRRLARGSGGGTLRDFVTAAACYAKHGGRIAMVFTATRTAELLAELRSQNLEPKRCRFVHPYAVSPASLVLVEARKGGRPETTIDSPLVLWDSPGVYSSEVRSILDGTAPASSGTAPTSG